MTKILAPVDVEGLLIPGLDPLAVAKVTEIFNSRQGRIAPGISRGPISHSLKDGGSYIYAGPLSLDAVTDTDFPDHELLGIISSVGSPGSHLTRHLEAIGLRRRIPIAIGVPTSVIDSLTDYQPVTFDASSSTVRLFPGDIPDAQGTNAYDLTAEEINRLQNILQFMQLNQWRRLISEDKYDQFHQIAKQALTDAKGLYQSEKARQEYVKSQVLPAAICEPYEVVKPDDAETVRNLLLNGLKTGDDVSIRTCFSPELTGKEPYKVFTTADEVAAFFQSDGYRALRAPIDNHVVTELFVGRFPKDKLNKDKEKEHAAWNYTVNDGSVTLTVMPGTAKLRLLGEAEAGSVLSLTVGPIRSHFSPNDPRTEYETRSSDEADKDEGATKFLVLINTKIREWEEKYDLRARLAALEGIFPHSQYASPTLEGQARISENGSNWVFIYGINIDEVSKV
ncbi:hypothetical protein HY214_00425 [Candidatus Roizmanbacteria bacterium]|nr:hypothetical protein [Candidatus Roizmanbacteria bacterium]